MIEFLMLSHPIQLVFLYLTTFLIMVQCVNFLLSIFGTHNRPDWRNMLVEGAQTFCIFYLYFKMTINKLFLDGLSRYLPSGFSSLPLSLILLILGLVCILLKQKDSIWLFVDALLFFPPLEAGLERNYFYVLISYMTLAAVRGIFVFAERRIAYKDNITAFSAKEAVDILPLGIAAASPQGNIYLVNPSMENILYEIFQRNFKDEKTLWKSLRNNRMDGDPSRNPNIVHCRFGGNVFRFRRYRGRGGEFYTYAYDLTEVFQTSKKIEEANRELLATREELEGVIERIDTIQREHEIIRIKSRMHDVIGFRISLIYRMLADGSFNKKEMKKSLEYLGEIRKEVRKSSDPDSFLSFLEKRLKSIGISLEVFGKFPEDFPEEELFVDAIREGTANAIKHGEASRILLRFTEEGDVLRMTVENDGIPPEKEITPKGGLKNLLHKAEEVGGTLAFEYRPRFKMIMELPRKEK